MSEVSWGVPNAEPVVRFKDFGEAGVTFNVVLRAREGDASLPPALSAAG